VLPVLDPPAMRASHYSRYSRSFASCANTLRLCVVSVLEKGSCLDRTAASSPITPQTNCMHMPSFYSGSSCSAKGCACTASRSPLALKCRYTAVVSSREWPRICWISTKLH